MYFIQLIHVRHRICYLLISSTVEYPLASSGDQRIRPNPSPGWML